MHRFSIQCYAKAYVPKFWPLPHKFICTCLHFQVSAVNERICPLEQVRMGQQFGADLVHVQLGDTRMLMPRTFYVQEFIAAARSIARDLNSLQLHSQRGFFLDVQAANIC